MTTSLQSSTSLLPGIRAESGHQFFTSLRKVVAPPGPSFIDGLDDALCLIDGDNTLRTRAPLQRGDYIEVQGGPASGKTQLLYFITATTILPSKTTLSAHRLGVPEPHLNHPVDLNVGGRAKGVYVVDFDGRWDTVLLADILLRQLKRRIDSELSGEMRQQGWASPSRDQLDGIVQEALGRFHICRPTSLQSVLANIMSLPRYIADAGRDHEILFLMYDGLSSFHWQIMAEQRKRGGTGAYTRNFGRILDTTTFLRHKFGITTITTNWALVSPNRQDQSGDEETRQRYSQIASKTLSGNHFPKPYPAAIPRKKGKAITHPDFPAISNFTHQIFLTKRPIAPFPASYTLEAALQDSKRQEQIRSGKSHGVLWPFDDTTKKHDFEFEWS